MTKIGNIQFDSAILCEDIRQEKTEKFILIGVFSRSIYLGKLPADLPLALFIPGVVSTPGPSEVHLRYSGPGEGMAIIKATLQTTKEDEFVNLVIPRLSVLMECEGTFKIDASADQRRWKPLVRMNIAIKEGLQSLPSTSFAPPSEQSPSDAQGSSSQPEPSRPSGPSRQQRSKSPRARPRLRQ